MAKGSLPRRTVLRGMGASLALPLLDAMVPRAFAAPKPAHRFQTFYVPNGMAMEYWTPKGEGQAFELSPILELLAPFRDQMLVLSGIKASWNYIHAGASGSFLTGTPRGGRNEIEIFADVSMDQLLARHFAKDTQVASLELSMDAPANAGACTGNLSCVYTHTLSWRSKTQPLPMEWNPPPVFEDHLALMLDLQLLAFQSDLTRVISFMIGKEQSARPYLQIGVPEAHHPLSHHNDIPELIAQLSKINRYHTQLFSQYLAKLRATPDGDGSLLDHTTILYGAGISNSQRHSGDNLPLMLVGGGSGRIKGGRHLKYTDKPMMANLLVTLMDKMDVPVDHVGGSNGKLQIDTLS